MQRDWTFTLGFLGRVFLSLFFILFLHFKVAAQTTQLTSVFLTLRSNTLWPVIGSTFDSMTSTFGPRIQLSTKAYDWHRGIDINAPLGAKVIAPLGGTFFGIKNYTDGGTTVILRHTFPTKVTYAGRSLTYFYTFYMHLNSVDPTLLSASVGKVVNRGDPIGEVGHSGSAVDDHLHWELRVGTPYSLEWQLANPTSLYGANNYGFDPHMHPMFLSVPYSSSGAQLTLKTLPTVTVDGVIKYTSNDDQPLLNRVEVVIKKKTDNSTVTSAILDFDQRLGYDATSDVSLNKVNTAKAYMSPVLFGTSTPYITYITIPASLIGSYTGSNFVRSVKVYDIWGRATQIQW